MARLVGVDLPRDKRLEVALTYIFGIGHTRALETLKATGVNPDTRVKDLTEDELLEWYEGKVPRWQRPDRVIFVETLPLGPTGKVVKARLREVHGNVLWDDAMAEMQAARDPQED